MWDAVCQLNMVSGTLDIKYLRIISQDCVLCHVGHWSAYGDKEMCGTRNSNIENKINSYGRNTVVKTSIEF